MKRLLACSTLHSSSLHIIFIQFTLFFTKIYLNAMKKKKMKKKKNKKKNESNERNGFILIEIPNFIALIAIDLIKKCNFNRTTHHSRIRFDKKQQQQNHSQCFTCCSYLFQIPLENRFNSISFVQHSQPVSIDNTQTLVELKW